jgi:hypothetical protein
MEYFDNLYTIVYTGCERRWLDPGSNREKPKRTYDM